MMISGGILMASDMSAGTKKSTRVYNEDQKKILDEINSRHGSWEHQAALMKKGIEEYGIHLDDIIIRPLYMAFGQTDYNFALYLLKKGINIKITGDDPLFLCRSLALAKFAIQRGANTEKALLHGTIGTDRRLAWLFFKYGADPKAVSEFSNEDALQNWVTGQPLNVNTMQVPEFLVGIGVPPGLPAISNRSPQHNAILVPRLQAVIARNVIAYTGLKNALETYMAANSQSECELVLDYVGHVVPDYILEDMEQVDAQADKELKALLDADQKASAADSKQSASSDKKQSKPATAGSKQSKPAGKKDKCILQ